MKESTRIMIVSLLMIIVALLCAIQAEMLGCAGTQTRESPEKSKWPEAMSYVEYEIHRPRPLIYGTFNDPVEDSEDIIASKIVYVWDERTDLCFAFYLGTPLGQVPCSHAKDGM